MSIAFQSISKVNKSSSSNSVIKNILHPHLNRNSFNPQIPIPALATGLQTVNKEAIRLSVNKFSFRITDAHTIQNKLKVSQPGDAFEQEADRIAEQIMHTTGTYAQDSTIAQPEKSGLDMVIEDLHVTNKTLEPIEEGYTVNNAHKPFEQDYPLTVGGMPLPEDLRNFYEIRFCRDFKHVRIHTGADSSLLNDTFHAQAFTYGNHIWLGNGLDLKPSYVLAHEMAHVVQQVQPRVLSLDHSDSIAQEEDQTHNSSINFEKSATEPIIQRFLPYWEPLELNGTKEHNEILPEFGKVNSSGLGLFTEAPVPNADKKGHDVGNPKWGGADFYVASTTVGVHFEEDWKPVRLKSRQYSKKNGNRFDHIGESAPAVKYNGIENIVTKVNEAPKDIKIGDLKPTSGTIEEKEGPEQLEAYIAGFEYAKDKTNNLPKSRLEPESSSWILKISKMDGNALKIPPNLEYPNATNQNSKQIVIKQDGKLLAADPKAKVPGKRFVHYSKRYGGIWNYFWKPNAPITYFPDQVTKLREFAKAKLIDPLLESPLKPQTKSKPFPIMYSRRHRHGPTPIIHPVQPSTVRLIYRKNDRRPRKDPFDDSALATWKQNHNELSKEFTRMKSTKDIIDANILVASFQAQEKVHKETGIEKGVPTSVQDAVRKFRQVEFWTGISSKFLGQLRRTFGSAFVKIVQVYQGVREKFQNMLKDPKRPKPTGGGFFGAALKAAFSVMMVAGKYVIEETVERLIGSIEGVVVKKLKNMFDPTIVEELNQKIQEYKNLLQQIEEFVKNEVLDIIENMIGPFEEILKKAGEILKTINTIRTIEKYVRWGSRVLACLSPPGWGCLWILAQEVLVLAAGKVAETCWFKNKIAYLIGDLDFVRIELPNKLAGVIIGMIMKVIPNGIFKNLLNEVNVDLGRLSLTPSQSDLHCNEAEDDPQYALNEEKRALWELIERIGEERYHEFVKLSWKWGIRKDAPLSLNQIKAIGDIIISKGITAEDMRRFAVSNPPDELMAKLVPMTELLNEVKSGPRMGGEEPGVGGTEPEGLAGGEIGGGTGQGPEGLGAGEGEGSGSIKGPRIFKAKPADISKYNVKNPQIYKPTLVSGIGPDPKEGQEVSLALRYEVIHSKGNKIIILSNVKAIVKEVKGDKVKLIANESKVDEVTEVKFQLKTKKGITHYTFTIPSK